MRRVVVDASVAVKWFLPEDQSDAALRWLRAITQPLVPDLLFVEAASVAWKKVRRDGMSAKSAVAFLGEIRAVPFVIWPSRDLAAAALDLALSLGRSVYDCCYVALALAEDAPLLTADRKLYDALASFPRGPQVRWIDEVPADE